MQFRLEAAAFAGAVALIRALGPDRASALSGAIWRRVAPFNKRHKRAEAHLRASLPALNAAEIAQVLDAMWENIGRTSAEAFHIGRLLAERGRFSIDPATEEALAALKARGGVVVSLHQGNWELAAPMLDAMGLPVAGVYQRVRNPHVEARVFAARAPFYRLGLLPKGTDAARKLLRVLSDRGAVTLLADQRDLTGVSVPFFGRPAPSTTFPALLARGRRAPLFVGAVQRERGATFRIRLVEIPVDHSADREADLLATTARIQATFEGLIRERPGQWMWGHRRWSR